MGNYNDLDVILKNRGYTRKPKSKPKEKEKTIPLGQQAYNLPLATMNQNAPIKLTDTPEARTSKMMQQVKASTPNGAMKDSLDVFNYENQQKAREVHKNNSVFVRYGIDPDNFTQADFEKWAKEHGFEYRMGGNDLTGVEMKWMPKQKKGRKFWEVVPSKEEQSDKETLETLAKNNSRKAASQTDKGAVTAAVVNAIDGLTFGAAKAYADWEAKRDYKKAGLDEDSFVSYKQASAKTENEHKFASAAGNIAGSLVSLGGLSKAVGAAASGVKWIAKAPGWVQSAINSGITFAVQSGAETAFDGGNFKDVLKSAGINLVGGAVGGSVSSKIGAVGEKLLFDKGLQHKVIPEMIRMGTSSAAFAGSKTASTYFLYPEDYRPTKEEMTKDIITAFAFGAISSGINTIKTSSQNKKYLDGLYQKMAADYESMAKANIRDKKDIAGIRKCAKNVIEYSKVMESYLTGNDYNTTIDGKTYILTPKKVRLVGQDKYVKSILDEITTVRSNANAVLNGIGAANAKPTSGSANSAVASIAPGISKTNPLVGNNAESSTILPTDITPSDAAKTPNIPQNTADSENAPFGTAVVTSAAAAEKISAQNSSAANTAVPETAVKTNTSGELDEIMSSEPITTFTPKTAGSEIKRLENILIEKGADDISRKEIIDTAVEIEKAHDGSDKNIRNIFNDVSKITNAAVNEMQGQTDLSNTYWKLFSENLKSAMAGITEESNVHQTASQEVVTPTKSVSSSEAQTAQNTNSDNQSTDSVINVGDKFKDTRTGNIITVVKRNANNTVVQVDNGTKTYPRVISNNFADSFAAGPRAEYMEKVNVTTENTAPVQSNTFAPNSSQIDSYINSHSGEKINVSFGNGQSKAFTIISSENGVLSFKSADGKVMSSDLNDAVQTDNGFEINYGGGAKITYTISPAKNINLTRVGDFYEAYGNDAADIADKLNLVLTTKVINGEKVQMTGFPAYALDDYTNRLGNGYNFNIADTNVSSTNAESKNADNSSENMYENLEKLGLTYDEKRAILEYKSSGSYTFNENLRNGEELSESEEKLKNGLNSALDKFPKYNGIAYRNIGFATQDEFNAFNNEHFGKHLITYTAFTSASKDMNGYTVKAPYSVHYEIECVNGSDISQIGIKSEQEILFKTDTTFYFSIVKNTGNSIFIKMKEVLGNGKGELNGILEKRRKQQEIQRSGSEFKNSGIAEEISGASDIVRGRSSAHDEIYNGASERNRGRAESRSESQDLGSDTEVRNDGGRERLLSGINDNAEAIPYIDKEKQNWENSNNIVVYENDEQFETFVEKVLKNEDTHKKIYFGKVPDSTAQMVFDKTGVDISGHNIALKGYEIRKILLNSHGNEKKEATRGQEAITTDDLKNIPSVITNPDNVSLSEKRYEGKPTLLFEKTIDNKNYVVAYVSRKHHDIEIQTISKKRSLAAAENADALSPTPETTGSTASDNMVPQNNDVVNSSIRTNAENDTTMSADSKSQSQTLGNNQNFSNDNNQAGISHRVNTETGLNRDEINKIISSINNGENISLDTVKNAVEYLINSENDIKSELSALKNSDLQKLLNPVDRSRRTKKADMVDGIYSDMLDKMYYAVTGSDTISYVFDGTPIDTRMKNMLKDAVKETDADSFSKLMEQNAAKYAETLKKRSAAEESLKNPQTLQDFLRKKNSVGLSEDETTRFERMYAEERKQGREKKTTVEPKNTSEAETFFSDSSNYTIEKSTHTKTGDDIWVVKPTERLEADTWKQLNSQIKSLGGVYWRGNQGWNFKKDPALLFANISEESDSLVKGRSNADKLRTVAESMQKAIDDKFKDRLTNTAKRAQEAARAELEGDRLKYLQSTINNIADAIESEKSTLLDKIDSRAQVETLIKMLDTSRRNRISETMQGITYDERLQEQSKPYSSNDIKYAEYPLTKVHENIINEYIRTADGKTGYKQVVQRLTKALKSSENRYVKINPQLFSDIDKIVNNLSPLYTEFWNDSVAERKRLARMGIENVVELRAYLRELTNYLPGRDTDAEKQKSIKNRERELANSKIDGFFPTPKTLVSQMLDEADIKPGEKVLEPSAGKGNIADGVKAKYPDNSLDVVEWNSSLNELLSDKGHNVIGNDFLQTDGEYDKIIMNPPFEKGQDIDHVKHAYDLLSNKGRIVAIMSEGAFSRSDKKAAEFREWLNNVGGTSQQLPEGTFKNSERSTGVNTRLVVIDKADSDSTPAKKKTAVHSSRDLDTTNTNQLKGLSDKLKESYETLKDKNDIFEINRDIISEMQGKNVTDKIYNYFNSIGGSVENPVLGTVELTKSGAKSTVFHGVGHDKIRAVEAIKPIIEKGTIISKAVDWKNRGYDTYIIAGKGNIDGSKSIVGVIVKTYPNNSKRKNKFYLHELIRIGVDSDAVAKDSRANVNESTPIDNVIISQKKDIVNTYSTQNNKKNTNSVQNQSSTAHSSKDITNTDNDIGSNRWVTDRLPTEKSRSDKIKESVISKTNKATEKINDALERDIPKISTKETNLADIVSDIRNKFNTDKLEMKDRLAILPRQIAKKEKIIADTTTDAKTVRDNAPKDFEITLGKTKYIERIKAAEALKRGLTKAPRNGTHVKIGSYRGLDLYYASSFDEGTHFILKGSGEYSTLGGDSASGNITRITNLAEKIGDTLEVDKALVANYKAEIETLNKEIDAEFPRAKELEELQAKLNDIDTQLGVNVSTVDMSDVIVDDEAGNYDAENEKYSITESEDFAYEQTRNDLLPRNGNRGLDESAGKQTNRVSSYKQRLEGKTQSERKKTAEKLAVEGYTEEVISGNHKYTLIKKEGYNDDMRSIVSEADTYGKEVGFFVGNATRKFDGQRNFKIDGIKLSDNKILIRYDGARSPQALLMHELVHTEWDSPKMQQATDIILSDLSENDKEKILQSDRYKAYMALYNGDEKAVWEEFIADIFAGMNDYSDDYLDNVIDYWYNDKVIDRYKPSEYINIMDAGGNEAVLDKIGFGNDYSLSDNEFFYIPYNEKRQLDDYVLRKNHSSKKLKKIDCKEIGNNFYVWENNSKTDYTVIYSVPIVGNEDIINETRSEIVNGTYRRSKSVNNWSTHIRSRRRSSTIPGSGSERPAADGSNDRLSVRQSGSDKGRYSSENRTDRTGKTPKYALSSYETDAESLTPERRKEIFEQYNKDHAGTKKTTQRQLWGERAAWVAHNMTRVFPNIPERGEKGTFFAEFRKSMIQWKSLPKTASFMVQDKLNKMTEGLTPDEFKTFSELVYFLDLQEEAQIQKERGYDEILLPNKITPKEVDEIVKVLNDEATDKVQQALIKRQNIWKELKNQYIDLNNYIGFETDGKFKRKNYYHHQVIDYMNNDKGGAGSREIGIKAGRGWLKERQGSTKAINTDFLAVENKSMLQMQYDVYIAETLGKIKQKYDIKPKLEKEAFESNKKALNNIIQEECTGKDGNIMLDNKGQPDSETYRKQKWYNARIMWGFSGLFDLAEHGKLPDYDGEYANVVEALKNHNLNANGLYKYVGIIANTPLPDNATGSQEQAVQHARTVLKYTAQKKAWIKELLADDYQTWETIAKSMSDTHTIHQPRRGNYFYTKSILDEDAFNKAHEDMVLSLVSGEVNLGNVDIAKLFEQYSDTVRLTGAAYEQWVLPKEIVTTMDEIANPKQVSDGLKMARAIVSAWKGWATSLNPLRTVKFGIRNLAGDLDAVIAGNPKVTLYSKQAVQEIYQAMRHKNYSDDFMEWVARGGYSSMIFANEMDTEMQDKLFSHLKDKQGIDIFNLPAKIFNGYKDGVENVHDFREAILRYSAYLYFKDTIQKNSGDVKDYVASNRYIVKGLDSVEDKAYQLSKDLLGAYDEVGKMGQTLRRYWIPFYSFTETNMKRYYRMFENIIMSDDKIPKKAGKLLLKGLMANLMVLLMIAWNKLVMKEQDDKLPPSTRDVPHITFGQIGDNVYAFRQLGSFSELLEWVGLDDYEWTKEDLTAPLDKAWGMITPFVKMPVELASGLNFYPSLTQPRAIRDKWQHFFNSLGVDSIYNTVTGKPTRGAGDILKESGEILKGSVIYSYDYKESAYYEILDIKREWQDSDNGSIYKPTPKSNALYYMKTAVRYKDKKAAMKYLDKYFENGGTGKGIKQAFAALNPMYGFTGKDTIEKGKAFTASLSEDEKEKLKIAQDFYENDLMLPQKVLSRLGKKDITDEEAKNLLKNYINAKCN